MGNLNLSVSFRAVSMTMFYLIKISFFHYQGIVKWHCFSFLKFLYLHFRVIGLFLVHYNHSLIYAIQSHIIYYVAQFNAFLYTPKSGLQVFIQKLLVSFFFASYSWGNCRRWSVFVCLLWNVSVRINVTSVSLETSFIARDTAPEIIYFKCTTVV
jgi:hypothetical protein